jgi:hypothetical protein
LFVVATLAGSRYEELRRTLIGTERDTRPAISVCRVWLVTGTLGSTFESSGADDVEADAHGRGQCVIGQSDGRVWLLVPAPHRLRILLVVFPERGGL